MGWKKYIWDFGEEISSKATLWKMTRWENKRKIWEIDLRI
jgi:hypothetical protein